MHKVSQTHVLSQLLSLASTLLFVGLQLGFLGIFGGCAPSPSHPKTPQEIQSAALNLEELRAHLLDPLPNKRIAAIVELENIPPHLTRAPLKNALRDPNPEARVAAIRSVVSLGLRDLFPELLSALEDPSEEVRAQAALALGALNVLQSFDALRSARIDASSRVRGAAVEAIASLNLPGSEAELLAALNDEEEVVALIALQRLGRHSAGRHAIFALLEQTRSPSGTIQAAALRALGRLQDPFATPTLISFLDDSQPSLRSAALQAIEILGDPNATEALLALLDPSGHGLSMTPHIIFTLGQLHDPRAITPLLQLAKRHPQLRPIIRNAVAAIGPSALSFLLHDLALADESHAEHLLSIIARIPQHQATRALLAQLQHDVTSPNNILKHLSRQLHEARAYSPNNPQQRSLLLRDTLDPLALALQDPRIPEATLLTLLPSLPKYTSTYLTQALVARYTQGSLSLQAAILHFVSLGEDPSAPMLLLEALRGPNEPLHLAAIQGLARLASSSASTPLFGVITDEEASSTLQIAAVQALGYLKEAGVGPLLMIAADNDAPLQSEAMWSLSLALREVSSPEATRLAVETLIDQSAEDMSEAAPEEIATHEKLLASCIDVIISAPPADPWGVLSQVYPLSSPQIQSRILQASMILKLQEASTLLLPALSSLSEHLRSEAAWVVGEFGVTGLFPVLIDRLHDPSLLVSLNATASLGKLGRRMGEARGGEREGEREMIQVALERRLYAVDPRLQNNALWGLGEMDALPNGQTLRALYAKTHSAALKETLYRLLEASEHPQHQTLYEELFLREADLRLKEILRLNGPETVEGKGELWYVVELKDPSSAPSVAQKTATFLYLPDGTFKGTLPDANDKIRVEFDDHSPLRVSYDRPMIPIP